MYKHKSLKGRSTTTKVSVFLQNFLNFIITKYMKQEINDGLSVCQDEYSPVLSRDQKIMTLLPPVIKCPINFYHGVAFTAQIG